MRQTAFGGEAGGAFVMHDRAATFKPYCRATNTSGTVLIPTVSAPSAAQARSIGIGQIDETGKPENNFSPQWIVSHEIAGVRHDGKGRV